MDKLPDQGVSSGKPVALKVVTGSAFNITSSALTLVVGFVRSVLLARLLVPEHYGVYALAVFFVKLASRPKAFGLNAALIHRHPYTREDVSTHFVLHICGGLLVLLIAILGFPILRYFYPSQPLMPVVVIVVAALRVVKSAKSTPEVLLRKQLAFRRLAALEVMSSVAAMIVAVPMAWAGFGVWSLVAEQASGILVSSAGLWLYRRPWVPSLRTRWSTVKWYLRFGWFSLLSSNLDLLLDRFDDFWAGTALGSTALGLYSKAYEMARYPRRVIANPVSNVFFPTFARLQHDRVRLSKAYYRVCSLIVRVGFLFAGTFALAAGEFIHLFLGDRWLPMIVTFQLMLVYTLFDPLLVMSNHLVTALGEPSALTKVKLRQMILFVPAVILLARLFGVNGIAVAADLMLLSGIIMMLPPVRRYVDFSLRRMIGYPTLGLVLALPAAFFVHRQLGISNAALGLLAKTAVTTVIYGTVLFIFEREQLLVAARLVYSLLPRGNKPDARAVTYSDSAQSSGRINEE